MPGLEADTSSYNQPLPVSPLDIAGKIGSLQQQQQSIQSGAIGIDKQKLDLMSQQFGVMNNELSNLIDSGATKQQAAERLTRISKTLSLPPIATNHMMEELNAAPDVKTFAQFAIRRGMDTMQKYGIQLGTNETQHDNKYTYQGVRQSPEKGGGYAASTALPTQIAPGTPGYDVNNQQQFEQPAGPSGVVPAPRARPFGLPAERPTTGATDGSGASAPTTISPAAPLRPGPSPLFDEGKKQYVADQELATQKLTAVKPALLALDKIPELRSGPGTKTWNEAVAALKANGIISIDAKNDSTAVYQEVNKYLSQYLKGRGTRSDADLVAAEESSPNVGKQISPALLKLTQTSVAQDRIEAARHTQFKKDGQTRTDFQNYGSHRAGFPASMDERAFIVDKMTPEQKQDLAKDIAKMKPEEKQRFVRSLKAYEDSKVSGNE